MYFWQSVFILVCDPNIATLRIRDTDNYIDFPSISFMNMLSVSLITLILVPVHSLLNSFKYSAVTL